MTPPTPEQMLNLYKTMMKIRLFEAEVLARAKAKEGLAIHPYTGHEAIAVGVISQLEKEDKVVSYHRPFGHFIAKGGNMEELMAELYGKRTGTSGGAGGEMNLSEPAIGFIQSFTIVGAGLTVATGVALAQKMALDRETHFMDPDADPEPSELPITVCFFGESASSNGAFNEALTLAKIYNLPIVFCCENNGYSTNTPAEQILPTELVTHRVLGYGIPSMVCDGSDVLAVWASAQKAIEHVRWTRGPYFLECLCSRIGPHKQILVDTRSPEEQRFARMRDPLPKFENALLSEKLSSQNELLQLGLEIQHEVNNAVKFAQESKPIDPVICDSCGKEIPYWAQTQFVRFLDEVRFVRACSRECVNKIDQMIEQARAGQHGYPSEWLK